MKLRFFLLCVLSSLFASMLSAQPRISYESLDQANRNPTWFRQSLAVPVAGTDSLDVHTFFRIPYPSILFRKSESGPDEWVADLSISFDVMTVTPKSRRQLEPEITLGRAVWTREIRLANFDETKSADTYEQGANVVRIPKQIYRVVPTVQINGRSSPISFLPNPEPPPSDVSTIFIQPVIDQVSPLNLGSNIRFGDIADLLLFHANDTLATVEILAIKGSKDSSMVWNGTLGSESRIGWFAGIEDLDGQLDVKVASDGAIAVHRFVLPSQNFENVPHRIVVRQNGQIVHSSTFLPRWFNIPSGLLNLDIAINMMKFALSEDALRDMRRGSSAERERKFNAYWKERDPSPESAYNELMAEYYSRIDHAFKNFSSPEQPGYDSIMGRTWILHGKPIKEERLFPADGATIVVWEYPARRFIFRATTGFGDFELVSSP